MEPSTTLTDVDRILATLAKVERVDLDKPVSAPRAYFSEREKRYIEARIKNKVKPDKRKAKYRKKMHWTTKRKKRREYAKMVVYPRALRKMCHLVESEGWYPVVAKGWKKNNWDVRVSKEEWDLYVEPLLRERRAVPFTERYYTWDNVITLDRIMIFDRNDKAVGRMKRPIFDGAEWALKHAGYAL